MANQEVNILTNYSQANSSNNGSSNGANISNGNKNNEEPQEGVDLAILKSLLQPDIIPEEIPHLKTAQKFQGIFTLFKELVRNNLSDFFVKMGILLFFSQDTKRTSWTPQELNQDLFWIQENTRKKIMSQLYRSNWITYNNGVYQLSTFGRSLLSMLTALMEQETSQENTQDALGASVSSLALVEMTQTDPTNTLRMFLNELMRIDQDIQTTLESKSEHHVRKLSRRVRSQFNIAIRSREHLKKLASNDYTAYRLKQEVHDRLSSFHSRLSQVQRAQNDLVARKIILADKSLTQHDINEFLIGSSVEQLAKLGKQAVGVPINIPDLVPQMMLHEAEWHLEKDRTKEERRSWGDMELANESQESMANYSRFLQFSGEINQRLSRQESFKIEETIPKDNWTTSSFRFCMLSVLESGQVPADLVNDVQVSCPRLKIIPPSNPPEVAVINDEKNEVKELTRGIVTQAKERKK